MRDPRSSIIYYGSDPIGQFIGRLPGDDDGNPFQGDFEPVLPGNDPVIDVPVDRPTPVDRNEVGPETPHDTANAIRGIVSADSGSVDVDPSNSMDNIQRDQPATPLATTSAIQINDSANSDSVDQPVPMVVDDEPEQPHDDGLEQLQINEERAKRGFDEIMAVNFPAQRRSVSSNCFSCLFHV